MKRAEEKGLATVAFSLISSGVFRGSQPLEAVLRIGVEAIISGDYKGLAEVHLVAFTDREACALCDAVASLTEP